MLLIFTGNESIKKKISVELAGGVTDGSGITVFYVFSCTPQSVLISEIPTDGDTLRDA